jgi:hypothetical protein
MEMMDIPKSMKVGMEIFISCYMQTEDGIIYFRLHAD